MTKKDKHISELLPASVLEKIANGIKKSHDNGEIDLLGSTKHDLKILPEYFELVVFGLKTFEVRKNDRNFKVGDVLVLREYDPSTNEYTGRKTEQLVTYILDDENYCKEGMVVLGMKRYFASLFSYMRTEKEQ